MKKLKLYLETTVFNWYFEPERGFTGDIQLLFDEIADEKHEAFASEYVIDELMSTKNVERRENLLDLFNSCNLNILSRSSATDILAEQYAFHKLISEKHLLDRQHLACATVNGLDAIISFNFSHINRIWTKDKIIAVNKLNNYNPVSIHLPMEVTKYEEI